ncbi:putative fatty acyl-CoA reductase CG5065 [Oppia nitens]|uniref:putative fatty acyl-CoA reductase CG5065 n=1 Tax=Oppia nitens TaxID=1686743 RepID=UPI0023DCE853|nr:putative fatty acyl-CoA reductase CG5065 [Oppia nitens]
MKLSQINQYYANRSVLITGGTGFVGKVLCEKLIRSCPQINTVYVLLRPKSNLSADERLDKEIINSNLFINSINIDCLKVDKLVAIASDICEPGLGLSDNDKELLISKVSVVFHLAASINFVGPVDSFIKQNVLATNEVMKLCDKMTKLETIVYVSTAYSNCNVKDIAESVYKLKHNALDTIAAINSIGESQGFSSETSAMSELMDDRPNPYTFSKAIAENLISEQYSHLPVVIVRPSIVTPVFKEPIPGWIDNFNGIIMLTFLSTLGIVRICEFLIDGKCDIIPVDILANSLVVTAWHTASHPNDRYRVINLTSGALNPITWKQLVNYLMSAIMSAPSIQMVRPANYTMCKPIASKIDGIKFRLKRFVSETLFAYFVDIMQALIGGKWSLIKLVNKLHLTLKVYKYFMINEWTFHSNNYYNIYNQLSREDQLIYYSDVRQIEWKDYICCLYFGFRKYQLREDDSNIDRARKRALIITIAFQI